MLYYLALRSILLQHCHKSPARLTVAQPCVGGTVVPPQNPRVVIRHEHFAQPGWMTSRQMYEKHIRSRWIGPVYGHWDLAMQYLVYGQGSPVPASDHRDDPATAPAPGTLHTLAPEVPRTFHRSSHDALTVGKNGYGSQLLDFANIRLNVDRVDWKRVPIDMLISQLAYDRHIKEHLASDETAYLDCLRGGGQRYAAQAKALVALVPCRADNDRRCWDEVLLNHFHLCTLRFYTGSALSYAQVTIVPCAVSSKLRVLLSL